jgi:hypothetical protein
MRSPRRFSPIARLSLFAFVALSVAACQTVAGNAVSGPLYGMIYDAEGRPVADAAVTLFPGAQGELSTKSDSLGRFSFSDLPFGMIVLRVAKEGYLPFEGELSFGQNASVAYVRLLSKSQVLAKAEDAIARKDWNEANRLVALALTIDPDDPISLYVRALVAYLSGADADTCAARVADLEGLVARGFREPFLYLLIADFYQFRLLDLAEAARYLELYLSLRDDQAVRDRLNALARE